MNAQGLIERYQNGERNFTNVYLSCIDLSCIDLRGIDLGGAILTSAKLRSTNLSGAILRGTSLVCTDLDGADLSNANLIGADLTAAILIGARLRSADLSGVNLRGADLSGAGLIGITFPDYDIPVIQNIHHQIYETINSNTLDMSVWHNCNTVHCWAGWVVTLAGKEGKQLEKQIGPNAAAALIYQKSDPSLKRIPDWFASNELALLSIKKLYHRRLSA